MLGAAGAVEALLPSKRFVIAMYENCWYKRMSDYIEANVYGEGQEADIEYAISNTFGFGGHNAVLAFKRWEA